MYSPPFLEGEADCESLFLKQTRSAVRLFQIADTDLEHILQKYWLPPRSLKAEVDGLLTAQGLFHECQTIVSGETENTAVYFLGTHVTIVSTPYCDIGNNVVLNELGLLPHALIAPSRHTAVVPSLIALRRRLEFPRLVLIALSMPENFPMPRLSLSVSSLANYVRRKQRGEVEILDMQLGLTIGDVVNRSISFSPDVIGISVSYGQENLAFRLIEEMETRFGGQKAPLIIAGNVIPSSCPDRFLARFPNLYIARGEGEKTIVGLLQHVSEGLFLEQVEGLIWLGGDKQRVENPLAPLAADDITFPALDTLSDLAERRGALTLELSRGCPFSRCTFCPRTHKAKRWKGLSASQAGRQIELMARVMDTTGLPRRLFLADEEFIGSLPGDSATERAEQIAQHIIDKQLNVRFDIEARVDQVYDPQKDVDWHTNRLRMWSRLRDAGLDRVFLGVESGSESQLARYGKSITPNQVVIAIRLLSTLGIGMRFGFIMFDPLMVGLRELKENVAFLERSDVFLRTVAFATQGLEDLFSSVFEHGFVSEHISGQALYTGVSYMLASLEVLINSRYEKMVEDAERTYGVTLFRDNGLPDTNMGRRKVRYLDSTIGMLSDQAQRWIDRNFALAYALKSFYKTAFTPERKAWMYYITEMRRISHVLLKTIICQLESPTDPGGLDTIPPFSSPILPAPGTESDSRTAGLVQSVAARYLDLFERRTEVLVDELETDLESGHLTDNAEDTMKRTIRLWRNHMGDWGLINDPGFVPTQE